MKPTKNKHYFYKGNEYEVVGITLMKSTLDRTWVEAVQYQKVNSEDKRVFTRELNDFVEKFCPKYLEIGMRVIAESMGKIVGNYYVRNIIDDIAILATESDKIEAKFRCKKEVTSQRILKVVSGNLTQAVTLYVELKDTENAIENDKTIENINVMLIDATHRIQKIDRASNKDSVKAVFTKIENLLKRVYGDFSI